MPSYDVIVIGLGGMGSAAAYQLADRGQRVLGLEQFSPGARPRLQPRRLADHPAGLLRGPGLRPAAAARHELWEQLERDSGRTSITSPAA